MCLPGLGNVRCLGVWTVKFVYASLVFSGALGGCVIWERCTMIVAYFDFKICFVWCSPKMWLPGLRNVRCVGVWTLKFVYASLVSFFRRTSGMCLLGAVAEDDCVFGFKISFVWRSPRMCLPGLGNLQCGGVWNLKFVFGSFLGVFSQALFDWCCH